MSGIVLLAIGAALVWTLPLPRPARVAAMAALALAGIVNGVASVYEGVHWPSDVLGGYLWAAVLLLPAFVVADRLSKR